MFEYVQKSEYMPIKEELEQIIHRAQDIVRDYFTFSYRYIGSSSRNMITCDYDSNIGFDFDVNIYVNDDNKYEAKEIKHILMNAFNRAGGLFGYKPCEDSTRVFTMKFVDRKHFSIHHSCDFAIVNDYIDKEGRDRQQFIKFNKKDNSDYWEDQGLGYYNLPEKEDWLKNNNCWNDVRKCYIDKKNDNTDPDKKSRSLYAEAVNEVYNYYNS